MILTLKVYPRVFKRSLSQFHLETSQIPLRILACNALSFLLCDKLSKPILWVIWFLKAVYFMHVVHCVVHKNLTQGFASSPSKIAFPGRLMKWYFHLYRSSKPSQQYCTLFPQTRNRWGSPKTQSFERHTFKFH